MIDRLVEPAREAGSARAGRPVHGAVRTLGARLRPARLDEPVPGEVLERPVHERPPHGPHLADRRSGASSRATENPWRGSSAITAEHDPIGARVIAEEPRHGFSVARELAADMPIGQVWTVRRPLVYRRSSTSPATG